MFGPVGRVRGGRGLRHLGGHVGVPAAVPLHSGRRSGEGRANQRSLLLATSSSAFDTLVSPIKRHHMKSRARWPGRKPRQPGASLHTRRRLCLPLHPTYVLGVTYGCQDGTLALPYTHKRKSLSPPLSLSSSLPLALALSRRCGEYDARGPGMRWCTTSPTTSSGCSSNSPAPTPSSPAPTPSDRGGTQRRPGAYLV